MPTNLTLHKALLKVWLLWEHTAAISPRSGVLSIVRKPYFVELPEGQYCWIVPTKHKDFLKLSLSPVQPQVNHTYKLFNPTLSTNRQLVCSQIEDVTSSPENTVLPKLENIAPHPSASSLYKKLNTTWGVNIRMSCRTGLLAKSWGQTLPTQLPYLYNPSSGEVSCNSRPYLSRRSSFRCASMLNTTMLLKFEDTFNQSVQLTPENTNGELTFWAPVHIGNPLMLSILGTNSSIPIQNFIEYNISNVMHGTPISAIFPHSNQLNQNPRNEDSDQNADPNLGSHLYRTILPR